jgi:hypothetical protein
MTLSKHLYDQCHAVLLKCSEFDDHNLLKAIFVTNELRVFQNRLPRATAKNDQVTQTIAYLLEARLSGNYSVFSAFLVQLRDRREQEDALHGELNHLHMAVVQELKQLDYIDIPFVVVAMSNAEAEALFDESVFANPIVAQAEQEIFQQFKAIFPKDELDKWLSRYAEERDEWEPRTTADHTIHTLISSAASSLNQVSQTTGNISLVRPYFYSKDFLSPDDGKRIETWEHLSRSGCVMIVDAVTLFHPILYRRLLQSELSSNPNVAISMLVLSPEAHEANNLIEKETKQRLERAFARFDRFDDRLCQLDVGQERNLRRWLVATLPEMANRTQLTLHPNGRQIMQQQVSLTHDMASIISGQGW